MSELHSMQGLVQVQTTSVGKQEKQEKQETLPKSRILTEGKTSRTLGIPLVGEPPPEENLGKKTEISGN